MAAETKNKEEVKRILEKVTKENDLSKQEIEALENLTDVNGGISQGMQKALIGIGSALGGAALGAAALYGGQRFNKWNKERGKKSEPATADVTPNVTTPKNPGAGASISIVVPGPLNKDGSFGNYMDPPEPESTPGA